MLKKKSFQIYARIYALGVVGDCFYALCVKRGKSGLPRLGFHLTNGYRKIRESATESKPPSANLMRIAFGKGERAR